MQIDLQSTQPPKKDKAYDLANFRVLIVEDYPFIAQLLSSSLLEMGVGHVSIADSVADAKEKILSNNAVQSSRNFDVVLLDWLMPDGDGGEVLQWVRGHKSDSIKYLPIIVCSAYASAELVIKSRDFGANEAMVKPVSALKVSRRMLHVIDHPRPYVMAPGFFGPDRRRKTEKFYGEDRRKLKAEDIAEHHEQLE